MFLSKKQFPSYYSCYFREVDISLQAAIYNITLPMSLWRRHLVKRSKASLISNVRVHCFTCCHFLSVESCLTSVWNCHRCCLTGAAGFSETTMTCSGLMNKECSATFCISRQGIINVNKSGPMFSFRRKSKFTKMAEHFEYNHIPAHLSSIQNFHVKSVLCYRGDIVVLHLVRSLMTQFGVIDLGINKFMGIFGKKSVEFVNEALRGEISPDCTMCLIRMPSLTAGSLYHFYLFSLQTRELMAEIEPPYNHALFTFDPRFCGSQLAVTSFVRGEDNSLSLVRLPTWDVVTTNTRVDDLHSSLSLHLKVRPSYLYLTFVILDLWIRHLIFPSIRLKPISFMVVCLDILQPSSSQNRWIKNILQLLIL